VASAAGDFGREEDLQGRIDAARQGSSEALGELLKFYRDYLLLVAVQELDPNLRAKVAPSDLVQETFLKAQQDIGRFQGETGDEFRAWLRRIMMHHLANVGRSYRDVESRAVDREQSLEQHLADLAAEALVAPGESPSAELVAQEEDAALHRALACLAAEHREVIRLRYEEHLTFPEIGRRLSRTGDAVRKLFARAIVELTELLKEASHEPP